MTKPINSFADFWPFYVCAHSHPGNRLLHFIATLSFLPLMIFTLLYNPWVTLFIPIFAYGLAWYGHYFIEKNKPATFGHPLWSFAADCKMIRLMYQRKMDIEVKRCQTLCGQK